MTEKTILSKRTIDFDYRKCRRYDSEHDLCMTESTINECEAIKLGFCPFECPESDQINSNINSLDCDEINEPESKQSTPPKKWKGYRKYKWADTRNIILNRDHYTCRNCGKNPSCNVHHLNDPRFFPKRAYDADNLIILCDECHLAWHSHPNTIFQNKPEGEKQNV